MKPGSPNEASSGSLRPETLRGYPSSKLEAALCAKPQPARLGGHSRSIGIIESGILTRFAAEATATDCH